MKIEYDSGRQLLYLWFGTPGEKAAQTLTVVPGMHADFDTTGKLIGIEMLDPSEIMVERVLGGTTHGNKWVGSKLGGDE